MHSKTMLKGYFSPNIQNLFLGVGDEAFSVLQSPALLLWDQAMLGHIIICLPVAVLWHFFFSL